MCYISYNIRVRKLDRLTDHSVTIDTCRIRKTGPRICSVGYFLSEFPALHLRMSTITHPGTSEYRRYVLFCRPSDTSIARVIILRQGKPKLATLMSFSSLPLTISGSLAKRKIFGEVHDAVYSCMGAFVRRGSSNRVSSSYFEEGTLRVHPTEQPTSRLGGEKLLANLVGHSRGLGSRPKICTCRLPLFPSLNNPDWLR